MAFRLDPRLTLAAAVKQAGRAEFDAALDEVTRDVHEARKRCKKLRALLRLLRGPLAERYAPLNAGVRNVARSLAGRRVLEALLETWPAVSRGLPAALRRRIGTQLKRHVAQELQRLAPPAGTPAALARLRRDFDALILTGLPAGALLEGLRDTYRTARRRYRRAGADPTAPNLHNWRKQAKYHGYQCALVAPLWPALDQRIKHLKQLSDLLGRHHDLEELARVLEEQPVPYGGATVVLPFVENLREQQAEVASAALDLGETLFGAKARGWWLDILDRHSRESGNPGGRRAALRHPGFPLSRE